MLAKWGLIGYVIVSPRTARVALGGMVFHVLNLGVARMQLFEKLGIFRAERVNHTDDDRGLETAC